MHERITTCINVERGDLERLQIRDIELSELVRCTIKEVLAETPMEKLKLKADRLRETIKTASRELELIEKEMEMLESEEEEERVGAIIAPVNSFSKGFVFHHLHIEGDNKIGIYLPKEVHRSVGHSSISGRGMREMNKNALLWLCEQSMI